ncbi:MAG: hypothetical protein Kow0088_18090 [Anaerolineales bacterium]
MPFTLSDFHEWARILKEHPEWRDEARRLILTDELLEVPQQLREIRDRVDLIYESQQRTEGRVDRLEVALAELAEAQRRSEERLASLEDHSSRLEKALAELAEAQRRSEERLASLEDHSSRLDKALAELAEAQRRTEERVGRLEVALAELAEAQRRTEERVGRLEVALAELAEAQRRTEERVEELAVAQAKLGKAIGELQRAFGSTVEEEAASVAGVILRRKGYRLLQEAFSIAWDGEIDVVLPVEDAQGKKIWVLVEAKARLSQRDVRSWSQRVRDKGWYQQLKEKGMPGPFLIYMYSIRTDLGAREQAEEEGIGLLKSDGEALAPRSLIEPLA